MLEKFYTAPWALIYRMKNFKKYPLILTLKEQTTTEKTLPTHDHFVFMTWSGDTGPKVGLFAQRKGRESVSGIEKASAQ